MCHSHILVLFALLLYSTLFQYSAHKTARLCFILHLAHSFHLKVPLSLPFSFCLTIKLLSDVSFQMRARYSGFLCVGGWWQIRHLCDRRISTTHTFSENEVYWRLNIYSQRCSTNSFTQYWNEVGGEMVSSR